MAPIHGFKGETVQTAELTTCYNYFFSTMYLDGLRLSYVSNPGFRVLEHFSIIGWVIASLSQWKSKQVSFFPTFSCKRVLWYYCLLIFYGYFFTIIFRIGKDSWEEIICVTVIYNISFTWDGSYKHEEEVYHDCYCTDIWVFSFTNHEREDSYIRVYFSQIWDSPYVRIEIEVTNLHHSKYRLVETKPLKAWSCSKMFTSLSFPRDFRILPFKRKYL